jgi:hypothetical protein
MSAQGQLNFDSGRGEQGYTQWLGTQQVLVTRKFLRTALA